VLVAVNISVRVDSWDDAESERFKKTGLVSFRLIRSGHEQIVEPVDGSSRSDPLPRQDVTATKDSTHLSSMLTTLNDKL